MNTAVLAPHIQKFIKSYKGDLSKLAFSGSPFPEVTVQDLLQQIEGRLKANKKLDYLLEVDDIYFPPKINLEQTSSQQTALYKASLIIGEELADVTGGLGIDTFHFSKNTKNVDYFELNEDLVTIAKHNFDKLDAPNISVVNGNGLALLNTEKKYDTIYIDPSRRTESKQKVFFLNDCLPNVPKHIDELLNHCTLLMIKTSPMLDIQVGLQELKNVSEIHVVAVNNEVKELLWLCKPNAVAHVQIKTINIKNSENECFNFQLNTVSQSTYSSPSTYLYEPNAAILKAGGFSHISDKKGLFKLHQHTHLFTSEMLMDFPGRRFKIVEVIPYSKKEMKANIAGIKANVTTRNFTETVAAIRKKWKLKDGGDTYLFFSTLHDNSKVVIKCEKIKD
ncbi:hypothetical protein SCB49_12629 [unidentified eubacterium SCB49]|nr:hypothetical protein SCB49_12629 [unidentified eubacterium SCB49]